MSTIHWIAAAGLLLGTPLPGTAAVTPQESQEAPASEADARLQALVERFNARRAELMEAYRAAKTDEERTAFRQELGGASWIPEFEALAAELTGTDAGARARIWVLRLSRSDKDAAWKAIQGLLDDSIGSPVMEELAGELRYASYIHGEEKVLSALERLRASPHERVQAISTFISGAIRLESEDEATRKSARECLETVVSRYGSLAYRGKSTFGAAAGACLFELDHLQIGMKVPDFEAVDENGVSWKLSDYAGKVVVVDFWGAW